MAKIKTARIEKVKPRRIAIPQLSPLAKLRLSFFPKQTAQAWRAPGDASNKAERILLMAR